MNILYIANNVSLPGSNGGTVHAHEVAKGLKEKGHNVFIICEKADAQDTLDMYEGCYIIRLSRLFRKFPYTPFIALYYIKYFFKFIEKFDFVIERNSLFGGVGKILASRWKVPYLLEVNTAIYDELFLHRKIENKFTKNIVKFIKYIHFKTSDHIIGTHINLIPKYAHSKFTLTIWGVNTNKFDYNIKNSKKVNELKTTYGLNDKFTILLSTSDSKSKGLYFLVELIKYTVSSNLDKNICFLIVGVEKTSNLYNACKENDLLDYCIFTGKVPYDDVQNYMAMGDIGIATYSKKEHKPYMVYDFFVTPIKVLEYQSLGLPVVGPDIGNMKKIVENNKTGFLVEDSNAKEFAEAIIKLKNKDNFEILQKNCIDFAINKLSWKHHIGQLNKLVVDMKSSY